jgi:competence protein ComEA
MMVMRICPRRFTHPLFSDFSGVFMLKKLLAIIAFLFYAAAAFAANVDANTASATDLHTVKGIGPVIAGHIIDARKQGPFKDWSDLITRVKGIGSKNAVKFSAEGLTVGGASYSGAAGAVTKSTRTHKAANTAAAAPVAQAPKADASASKKHRGRKSKNAAAVASAAQ